jgi:hypothetical protein
MEQIAFIREVYILEVQRNEIKLAGSLEVGPFELSANPQDQSY